MGLVHSTLCALSFMLERVFTWFSCAMCSICLLFAMMSMCIYGISVGYHYAQKEIAQWTEPYRQYHKFIANRKQTVGTPGTGLIRNIWNLMWAMPKFVLWDIPKFFLLEIPGYLLDMLPHNPLGRRRSAGGGVGNSTAGVGAAPGPYGAMPTLRPGGESDPRAPWYYPTVSPPVWYSVDTSTPPPPTYDTTTQTPFPWAIEFHEQSKTPILSARDFETEEKTTQQKEAGPMALAPLEQKDWWNVYLPESTTVDLERNIVGLKKFLPRFRSYKAKDVQKRPS